MNNEQCDSPDRDSNIIQSLDFEDNQQLNKQSTNQVKVSPFGEEIKSKLQFLRDKVSRSKAQTEKELNDLKNTQRSTQFNRYGKFITNKKFSGIVNLIENKHLNSKRIIVNKDNLFNFFEFKRRPKATNQSSAYNIYQRIQEVTCHISSRGRIMNQICSMMSRKSNPNEYNSKMKSKSQPNIFKLINDRIPNSTTTFSLKRYPSFSKEYYQKELDSFSLKLFDKKENKSSKSSKSGDAFYKSGDAFYKSIN